MVYVVAGLVVLAVVAAALVVLRRRSAARPNESDATTSTATDAATAPMTGLEAALAQVTDRDGRPIGERIDAEAQSVDDLRVPDDTGPLLRRALDRVEHDEPAGEVDPGPRDAHEAD